MARLSLVKRKPSLSHTALNREVLCGHTHLCQARISVPNIWALSTLKACGLLSPCLICNCGCERLNGERPLCRVRLRALSIGLVSPRPEGTSIEARDDWGNVRLFDRFLHGGGIFVLVGRCVWAGRSFSLPPPNPNPLIWESHTVWHYIIFKFSQSVERLLMALQF